MLFGGFSRFSPTSADSCLPDVSGCPRFAPSDSQRRSQNPKLPFGSDHPTPAALHSMISVTVGQFPLSYLESAHPQNAPATPAESALPLISTYEKTPIRPGSASRLPAKVTSRMSFHRLIKSNLSEGSLRSFPVCVASACPDLSRVSRAFRGSAEGPSRRSFRFFGCPTFCALCNKWVSGLQLSYGSVAPQGQQNEHLRKNGRGVGRRPKAALASSASGPDNTLGGLAPRHPSA